MNKRAERHMWGFVIYIVIAAIALLLIIGIIMMMNYQFDRTARIKECQTSIDAYMLARQLTPDVAKPEINCPTEYMTIEAGGKEDIQKEMLDEAEYCWEMWKKGEYKFTQPRYLTRICHVCSVVDFENKNIKITEQEMKSYCNKNNIGKQKISEYFAPVFEPSVEAMESWDWSNNVCSPIDTSKRYAIIYAEYTEAIDPETEERAYTDEEARLIAEHGPKGEVTGFWLYSKKLFGWIEDKLGWEKPLDVHVSSVLMVEYEPEDLSVCYMTVAGQ